MFKLQNKIHAGLVILIVYLLVYVLIQSYVSSERTIYFWDQSAYQVICTNAAKSLKSSFNTFIQQILLSIQTDDYNLVPCLIVSPLLMLFGHSRVNYILILYSVYCIPTILLTPITIKKFIGKDINLLQTTLLSIFTILFLPSFWRPTLQGYIDVVTGPVVFLIYIILIDNTHKRGIFVGLLLTVLALLRRYFIFFVIGTILIQVIDFVYLCVKKDHSCRQHAQFILSIVISFIATYGALAYPYIVRVLHTNYASLYSSYKFNIYSTWDDIINVNGIIPFLLILYEILYLVKNRELNRGKILIILQSILTFILFYTIQSPGTQHILLFVPLLLLLGGAGVIHIHQSIQNYTLIIQCSTYLLIFGLLSLNSLISFYPLFYPLTRLAIFPKTTIYPQKRPDLTELLALIQTSYRLIQENKSSIYVLSSSFTLNSDIFINGCNVLNFSHEVCRRTGFVSEIDMESGYPKNLFESDYIIITIPTGYHLNPDDQRVIGVPAQEFITNEGLSLYFERQPQIFHLQNNTESYIYKKVSPIPASEKVRLSNTLKRYYPSSPQVYTY